MADEKGRRRLTMSWVINGVICIAFVLALSPATLVEAQRAVACSQGDNNTCHSLSTCADDGHCSCVTGAFSESGRNNDCRNGSIVDDNCGVADCVYCTNDSGCVKCVDYLFIASDNSQACYKNCPLGSNEIRDAYLGRIPRGLCEGSAVTSSIDETVLIAIVCIIGALLLIVSLSFGGYCLFAFVKARRVSSFEIQDSGAESGYTQRNVGFADAAEGQRALAGRRVKDPHNVELSGNRQSKLFDGEEDYDAMFGYEEHSEELIQFLLKLDKLRRYSTEFLRMLNDMRRRLKELPADAPAAISYRNVMSDITRLLFLLNKKPENVEMPPDGMQLLEWSEQTLHHYLESQPAPQTKNVSDSDDSAQKRAMARRKQMEQGARSSRASSYEVHQAETHF